MGVAPSRETVKRGLYIVPLPGCGSSSGSASHKKLDIVLIPLTKEYFPSPDCPLFKQFHKTRCDAGVNYYFRHPGNPGDLSRIPHAGGGDGKHSYPSRDVLYSGVVERAEEMLFETDEDMRLAYEHSVATGPTNDSSPPPTEGGKTPCAKKRVLPIMCAVAFRYDPEKVEHLLQSQAASAATRAPYMQALLQNGVLVCGSIVNIVGCFGFVPMEVEGAQLSPSIPHTPVCPGATGSAKGFALASLPRGSLSVPRTRGGFSCSTSQDLHHLSVSPQQPTLLNSARTAPENYFAYPAPHIPGNRHAHVPSCSPSSTMSTASTTPTYDPCRGSGITVGAEAFPGVRSRAMRHRSVAPEENYNRFASLPPPVAAPLAAIVFLTKSAGEQNLSRVTFVAASTYYGQLVEAGVLKRRGSNSTPTTVFEKCHLPPLETFSFSSLMTNVPILSFVYEMRCRWEHLGLIPRQNSAPHSRTSSLNLSSAFRGSAASEPAVPSMPQENFEMWITEDGMFHGRIGKELAERLCLSMAERPEVSLNRPEPLPDDRNYWRFRGLVDRNNHPPSVPCGGGEESADLVDVYVMGAAVIDGFDEGDVLRYDRDIRNWVADRAIALDSVVLAAMRPYSKAARTAPPDDEGWVTMEVEEDEGETGEQGETGLSIGDEKKHDTTAEQSNVGCTVTRRKRRVHVCEGNFYIYRFELNGKTFYHGTVPDFANPNKGRLVVSSATPGASPVSLTLPLTALQLFTDVGERQRPAEKLSTEGSSGRGPLSTLSALFPPFPEWGEGSERSYTAYLPTRVRYGAVQAARDLMGSLLCTTQDYQPFSNRPTVSPSVATPQPSLPPPRGIVAPPARRVATTVRVGHEAEEAAAAREQDPPLEGRRTFARRFIDEAVFIWDWRSR